MKAKILFSLILGVMLAMPVVAYADENVSGSAIEIQATYKYEVPYSDGIYRVFEPDYDNASAGSMIVGGYHLEDKNGNILTDSYTFINELSGKLGLYQFSIPAGHSDTFNGVFRLENGKEKVLIEPNLISYRCIEIEDTGFFFPVFTNGEYYDLDGNLIDDLGIFIKKLNADGKNISLERDSWADEAIKTALDCNYLHPSLACNYKENITRQDYCKLAVKALENCGFTLTDYESTSPFTDTDDYYVSIAYNAGVVNGIGNNKFEPARAITRQEAAVLLYNLANVLDINSTTGNAEFNDDAEFADWAKDSIYKVNSIKDSNGNSVMTGVGNNTFLPDGYYTRQQAIATIYRLLDAKWL